MWDCSRCCLPCIEYRPYTVTYKAKRQGISLERSPALKEEVDTLLANDFVGEEKYLEWIVNPIMAEIQMKSGEHVSISQI